MMAAAVIVGAEADPKSRFEDGCKMSVTSELIGADDDSRLTLESNDYQLRESFPGLSASWTEDNEEEFLDLLKKKALGKATADERSRLAKLKSTRRGHLSTRSYEELCAQRETKKRIAKLLEAIDSYVQFASNAKKEQAIED